MKKSINEKALDNLLRLSNKTLVKVGESLKGTKPFAKKPIPPEDLIYAKATLGSLDTQDLVREYGMNKVLILFHEIDQMEQRRIKSGTIKPIQTETPAKAPVEGLKQGFGQAINP